MRDSQSYDYHCDLVEGVEGADDSVTYGINYRSPLNSIHNFHVASSQLPQDVMHVLFEGILITEVNSTHLIPIYIIVVDFRVTVALSLSVLPLLCSYSIVNHQSYSKMLKLHVMLLKL